MERRANKAARTRVPPSEPEIEKQNRFYENKEKDREAEAKEAEARYKAQKKLDELTKTGREDPASSVSQYLQDAAAKKAEAKEAKRLAKDTARAMRAAKAKAKAAETEVEGVEKANELLSAMLVSSGGF